MRFAADKNRFFRELEELLIKFLNGRGITFDPELLSEVVRYQWLRMPGANSPLVQQWQFRYNIPEFMEHVGTTDPVAICTQSQVLYVQPVNYEGNLNGFALERVVYGRKHNDVLWPVTWVASDRAPFEGHDKHRYIAQSDNQEGLGVW